MAEIYSTEEVEEHNTEEDGSFFFLVNQLYFCQN